MMAKLTESKIKNLAHDAGYTFVGKHWVHDKTGDKKTTDELLSKLAPKKKSVNSLITDKLKATRSQKPKK